MLAMLQTLQTWKVLVNLCPSQASSSCLSRYVCVARISLQSFQWTSFVLLAVEWWVRRET